MVERLSKWKNFQLSRSRDLGLGLGHMAYHHVPFIDLYLDTECHLSWTNLTMDGHWTDGLKADWLN